MKSLSIKLKNCYGIDCLDTDLEFDKSNTNIIYAPNGVMKTSLAKTFLKISKGENPEEKIYNKTPEFEITFDGNNINPDDILVIQPFDPNFEAKNISTLLVNTEKKIQYDAAYKEVLESKKKLIKKLNKISKIKQEDIENKISKDLNCSSIFEAIEILSSLDCGKEQYSNIEYAKVFDEKVIALLEDGSVKSSIQDYTTRYNELIENSNLFKKGTFNPINADTISKTLRKEKFFEASHKVLLNGREDHVSNQDMLDELFETEKDSILGDGELKEISKKILGGVASVKAFQDILEKFPEISAELSDLNTFKKILWTSYYLNDKEDFDALLASFESRKQELAEIERDAQLEDTLWHEAKDIFKARFHVPFNVDIEDHTNTILGTTAPNMVFSFEAEDGAELKFNRGQLDSLDFLSVGERRAMYLLYVIFEFKARLKKGDKTLIIIDDIADSFDYKNKYAIIEYLRELAEEELFRLVILTHNFDFYRTVQSRILDNAKWHNSYVAQKSQGGVNLLKGGSKDVSSPFELWKTQFKNNKAMLVSMIPFVRNLIEYKDGSSCTSYQKLTSMLHIKSNTMVFKISDLKDIISEVIQDASIDESINADNLIIDTIYEVADSLCQNASDDEICLENKVSLSIAIRLKAEDFMWANVIDKSDINGMQTGKLFDRLCKENQENYNEFSVIRKTLSQVTLMTPENIHLNSFMYEPLMDMSCHHLVDLYEAVKNLQWSASAP